MAFGRTTRLPEFADMPIGRELTNDAGALALIAFAELPFFMALPFAAPPDMPKGRAQALQSAFMAMCQDKGFVEEAERRGGAPPDMPKGRAQALQSAFMAMCQDKGFVEEAERLGLSMSPIDGEAILQLLARTAATPKDVIARYNAIGTAK
jgi:hypothetical protein